MPSATRFCRLPRKWNAVFGRVGWLCKAVIYGVIGGLVCSSVVLDVDKNESPQGVFVFLGSSPNGSGIAFLLVVLVGVLMYAIWRLTEAVSGQGYTDEYSKLKNFFRFRLSPFVSGSVYIAYAVSVIELLRHASEGIEGSSGATCFPECWRATTLGIIGLAVFSLALFIGFVTQIVPVFTGRFMKEMKDIVVGHQKLYWFTQVTGRVGFFGRALLFLLVAIAFAQVLLGYGFTQDERYHTMAQALNHWRQYTLGKVVLFTMGTSLVVYSLFAGLCVLVRKFPTRLIQD